MYRIAKSEFEGQFLTHIFGPLYCFFKPCARRLSGNLSVSSLAWNQVDCHKHLSFCWMASASPLWELTSFSQCQHHSILFELPIDDHLWELVRGKIQLDDAHSNVESLRFLKISDDEVSQSQYDGSHRVAVTPSWAFPDNSLPKRFYKKTYFCVREVRTQCFANFKYINNKIVKTLEQTSVAYKVEWIVDSGYPLHCFDY